MPRDEGTVTIEDAQILFSNFAGREKLPFNAKGDRNFCVLLQERDAIQLAEDGWNVKTLKAREEGDEPRPYLQVTVGYKFRPPKVVLISSRGRTNLDEDMIDILDRVDIAKADLIIRPFTWSVGGNSGIAAYLKSIFVVLDEDELDMKYADVEYAQRPSDAD